MLFYNSWKFGLHAQTTVSVPGQRDPNLYRLYYKYPNLDCHLYTIFRNIIITHMKAGNTSPGSIDRTTKADSIMPYMDANTDKNFIVIGDMNLGTSA